MKTFRLTTAMLVLMVLGLHTAMAQQLQERGGVYETTLTNTFDVDAGDGLEMDRITGAVHIETWSRSEVEIVEELRLDLDRDEAEEVVALSEDSYSQERGLVIVRPRRSSWDRNSWGRNGRRYIQREYTIKVPESFDVNVETSGGAISVTGLNGDIDVSTSGGSITATDIVGEIDASTSGGSLEFVNIDGDIDASTSGGSVELESINGEIDVSTSGGNIRVRDVDDSVDVSTSGGNIEAENIRSDFNASTSGGNIELEDIFGEADVTTSGGKIRLRNIKSGIQAQTSGGDIIGQGLEGPVEVSTSAGDIDLREVFASVRATTSVGDIDIDLQTPGSDIDMDIRLQTNHGDISISIPENMPASIEAEVDLQGRYDRNDIHSDFPLTRRGNRRDERRIRTYGEINGGGHTIDLSVSSGSIYIRSSN